MTQNVLILPPIWLKMRPFTPGQKPLLTKEERNHKKQRLFCAKLARPEAKVFGQPSLAYVARISAEPELSRTTRRVARTRVRVQACADPDDDKVLECALTVVDTITQVFALFRALGAVGRVARELWRQGATLPCRVMRGPAYGTITMQPVTYAGGGAVCFASH